MAHNDTHLCQLVVHRPCLHCVYHNVTFDKNASLSARSPVGVYNDDEITKCSAPDS